MDDDADDEDEEEDLDGATTCVWYSFNSIEFPLRNRDTGWEKKLLN